MTSFNSNIITDILDLIDEEVITSEYVVTGCLYWMGDDGVAEMVDGQVDFSQVNGVYPIESKSDLVEALDEEMLTYRTAAELILTWIGTIEVHDMVDGQPDLDGLAELISGEEDEE